MKKALLLSITLIITISSFGQNIPNNYDYILEQLNLNKQEVNEALVNYKLRPDNNNETIVFIPKYVTHDEYYEDYIPYILIVDSKSGKIKNRFSGYGYTDSYSAQWYSDAISIEAIDIDVAPYYIQANKRAFGIRVKKRGYSQPNPYSAEYLSLYATVDDSLILLLNSYVIDRYRGEWDTRCNGEFEHKKGIVIVEKTKKNGYYDLSFHNTLTKSVNRKNAQGDCETEETSSKSQEKYQFNGDRYVPEEQILVPTYYTLLESTQGDLDEDGIDEKAAVYETINYANLNQEAKRAIVIYKKKNDHWEIWKQSQGPILGKEDGGIMGDPFTGIDIKNGTLIINHYGGSSQKWGYTNTYRYQNQNFELIGSTVYSTTPCEESKTFDYNLSTGKVIYTEIIENCENETKKENSKTIKHKLNTLPNLSNYKPSNNSFTDTKSNIKVYY